jgi:hypothetical protein
VKPGNLRKRGGGDILSSNPVSDVYCLSLYHRQFELLYTVMPLLIISLALYKRESKLILWCKAMFTYAIFRIRLK